ncbi:recombinase RecA [Treponema sp. OMZ 855]|uniref:recombinase RecA n=1 Tax=Treponema sp. OMZ 855 TaxID=1643512 RepID=UPI0020A2BDD9|nr:recombinase RecA [Treponema sp. OMZ 855]UTC51787.1 recombinase RecA [Treponema sp. OMZ 855]
MAKTKSEINQVTNITDADEKLKALEAARLQIEKEFGQGSLMKLGTKTAASGIEVIPSGSILLDEALGIGGYPRGRIIEIFGPESSGKTTLALHVVAEAQKRGGIAAFVDAEHALDPQYAQKLGVNIDELWVAQPDAGEQALEITENLVRSGAVDVIVVDSVAALTPQAEIDGEMGDSHMGLQARLMSQALRKLTAIISRSKCILIFINQIRMKIGIAYGNPETTTGGNALKFYSSVRIEVRKGEVLGKDEDEAWGNKVRIKVVKNKVAPPFRKVELEILFGKGISPYGSLLDCAVKYELIDKKGAWYSYKEDKIGQGHDNAVKFLEDNPDVAIDLEKTLRAQLFPNQKYVSSFVKTDQADSGTGDASAAAKTGASKAAASVKPGDTKTDKEADAQTAPAGKKSMLEKAALASGKTESLDADSAAVSAAHKSKPGSAFDGDNELF